MAEDEGFQRERQRELNSIIHVKASSWASDALPAELKTAREEAARENAAARKEAERRATLEKRLDAESDLDWASQLIRHERDAEGKRADAAEEEVKALKGRLARANAEVAVKRLQDALADYDTGLGLLRELFLFSLDLGRAIGLPGFIDRGGARAHIVGRFAIADVAVERLVRIVDDQHRIGIGNRLQVLQRLHAVHQNSGERRLVGARGLVESAREREEEAAAARRTELEPTHNWWWDLCRSHTSDWSGHGSGLV